MVNAEQEIVWRARTAGFVIGDEFITIRGSPTITADSVLVFPGTKVWPRGDRFIYNDPLNKGWKVEDEAAVVKFFVQTQRGDEVGDISALYSSPEAAIAAANAARVACGASLAGVQDVDLLRRASFSADPLIQELADRYRRKLQ